jgi:TldD protein
MPSFSDIAESALAEIRGAEGLDYADARVVSDEHDVLAMRNHSIERLQRATSAGVGVRVLIHGAWGYAGAPDPSPASAAAAARRAVEIARGVAAAGAERVRLAEEEPQRGSYATPVEVDPFSIPTERRVADLTCALDALRGNGRGDGAAIKSVTASMRWDRTRTVLATTEGTRTDQTCVFGGAGVGISASDGDSSVHRSYPFDYDGGLRAAGYEFIDELDLTANAERIRDETVALLSAPDCPAGRTTLVLDTPQLALQIHESCGHPTECDRALGDEVSLAGASFLTPDRLGRFSYGAPIVNMTADSLTPGGLGTFGWDDEGVPARRTPLVSRGVFVGYLSSRETAEALGLGRSAGCMRAESWSRPPIIRMINVSLEPDPNGPSSLDELIADTRDGILMTTNRSWSIDDLRLNFQFSCEAGWEIVNGKRGRLLRNPLYTGSTPGFWGSCDAIGNADAWRLFGLASCGKGDPMQAMAVGHGCAPARFRDVEVGCSR